MKKLHGFSLMEMMIVLLIVAVVAAASAPMVSRKMVSAAADKSPWIWVGNQGNIAFNPNGGNPVASIGALQPNGINPRLYINSNGGNPGLLLNSVNGRNLLSLTQDGQSNINLHNVGRSLLMQTLLTVVKMVL